MTTSITMKRQKNLIQTRLTQTSSPEKESGEIDLTNLPEKEFKIKVITIEELRDEVWRKITEIRESLEGLKSRLDEVQEAINGIEIREQEGREADAERDKRISRNERILRELCDQSKRKNIHIIGVGTRRRRERKRDRKCL